MTQIVGTAAVSIFPTFKGLRAQTAKEAGAAGRTFGERFGRTTKTTLGTQTEALAEPLKRAVTKANRELTKARNAQRDNTAKVEIAEKRLAEVLARSGAESSQAMRATLQLEQAKRKLRESDEKAALAAETLRVRQEGLTNALKGSERALGRVAASADSAGKTFGTMGRRFRDGFKDVQRGNAVTAGLAGSFGALTRHLVNAALTVGRVFVRPFVIVGKVGKWSLGVLAQGLAQIHKFFAPMNRAIVGLGAGVINSFASAASAVKGFAVRISSPVLSVIGRVGSAIKGFGVKMFTPVASAARRAASAVVGAVAPVAQSFVALGSKLGGAISTGLRISMGGLGAVASVGWRGVQSAFTAGLNGLKSAASSIGSIAAGAVTAAFAGVTAAIASNMSGAVSRVDTMNNFPRVMKNLGFNEDESSASIGKLDKGIRGLPTALNDIVAVVQDLAPLGDNLSDTTDLALALNNALLAGGKGSADASRALRQYSQMLGKQEVDMQSWRTLMEVMPGQLSQLAKSLIDPTANGLDLYAALKDGTITFDEFNAKIIELNKTGVLGFASFEQQARDATAGIATGFANIGTAIKRNVGNAIVAIGVDEILAVFSKVRESIDKVGSKVVEVIKSVKELGNGSLGKAFSELTPLLGKLAPALGLVFPLLQKLPFIGGAFSALTGPVGVFIGTLIAVWTHSEKLRSAFSGAFDEIKKAFEGLNGSFSGIGDSFGSILKSIGDGFAPIVKAIGRFIAAAIPVIGELVKSISKTFGKLFEDLGPTFTKLGESLGQIFSELTPLLWPLAELISELFEALAPIIAGILPPLVDLIGQLAPIIGTIVEVLVLVLAAVTPILEPLGQLLGFLIPGIVAVLGGLIGAILSVANTMLSNFLPVIHSIKDAMKGWIDFITGVFTGNWNQAWAGLKQAFWGHVSAIGNLIRGSLKNNFYEIPRIIFHALEGARNWLPQSGRAIIDGFIDGIRSKFAAVRETLGRLTSMLPSWKGPEPLDRVILKNSGRLVIGGFVDGLESKYPQVENSLADFTKKLAQSTPPPLSIPTFDSHNPALGPTSFNAGRLEVVVNVTNPFTGEEVRQRMRGEVIRVMREAGR